MKSHTDIRGPLSVVRGPESRVRSVAGRVAVLSIVGLSLAGAAGCRQDMHNQPKYRALRGTDFFADGGSARPLVEGTVARGTLGDNEAFFTGKTGNATV